MRSRRAWVYVLTIAALVVPAGGIAYLGAVSYRNERGAVSAQNERQRQAALGIAHRISRAVDEALDATEGAVASGTRSVAAPLARYWFWIDADQHLRVPHFAPPTAELGGGLEHGVGCAGGRLEDCVHELSTRRSRVARLSAAQRAEAGGNWAEARRQYATLATFADTGPVALLGLARVLGRLEDGRARDALAELERRFGDRSFEGIPVRLVAAVLRAEAPGSAVVPERSEGRSDAKSDARADALFAIADDVLAGAYALTPVVRFGVLARLRSRLPSVLAPDQARRLARLDAQILELRTQARTAEGLADDLPEILRTATPAWRGRAANHEPARTVIYRRRADGGVIGLAVDAPMLEAAAGLMSEVSDAGVALHARALVLPPGTSPGLELRTIQQVPLGAALPHLSVAIVNPLADPDPLDAVIRERSRRHVMYTSALAIALGLGLVATIRGAARARELAQLKSDFVSTVSHELKTPLTSIRMFAEMLEQGVAKGDPGKLARYHGVIVQESQRLGLLISNLLDYAQIEKGSRRYAPTRQGIAELARHAVTTFETLRDPESGGRNPLTVVVSPGAMHAEVEADRDVVVGAVLNLLANAAKYGGTTHTVDPPGEDRRPAGKAVGVPTSLDRASPIDLPGEDRRPADEAVGVPIDLDRASPIDPPGEDRRPAGEAVGVPAPVDPTGEAPRPVGKAVGGSIPLDRASPIEVEVGADAGVAWIGVRDHGPGIPPAEQARIFREFYRAPEAYRSGVEGTGLGLALVKRHIEALGGTVEVASVVGEGATFTIRLPRVAGGPEAA